MFSLLESPRTKIDTPSIISYIRLDLKEPQYLEAEATASRFETGTNYGLTKEKRKAIVHAELPVFVNHATFRSICGELCKAGHDQSSLLT